MADEPDLLEDLTEFADLLDEEAESRQSHTLAPAGAEVMRRAAAEITELRAMLRYCQAHKAAPGEPCADGLVRACLVRKASTDG